MPVTVNAETFKKALNFLVTHNYSFDSNMLDEDGELARNEAAKLLTSDTPGQNQSKAVQLRRR